MAFDAKGLTSKGRNLQAKAQAGAELKYTKFVMGDGVLGNQSIGNLTDVISPKKTVTVTRVFVVPADQRANVGMYFTNADVTTAFTWREIGLYALDPDEGEILYWYGYDVTGTVIPVGGGSEILEQTFDTMVFVGTAQNVSSTVDQSLVFATVTEMNQFLTDSKAYTDTKFASATIPDASLTQKGKVQLTNAIDSTSQTLAPTAKAVSDARQAAISTASTDATTKADAAEINAKNASLPRTGGSISGPLKISSWGTLSAGTGGYFLCGQNCYLDSAGTTFRYQNNHSNMGARGFVFRLGFEGAWYFDTGLIATTQDQVFTPNLSKIVTASDAWQKYKLTQDNGSAIFKGTIDANSLTSAGRYSLFSNSTNIPSANDHFIDVTTYTEGGKLIIKQEARPFGGNGYCQRHYYSDTGQWSPWSPDVFQSGVDAKQGIVNAINAKGGSASMNDTWAQLAAKINAIQQGQYQRINMTTNQYVGTINVNGASLGVHGPVFANIAAGTRIISIQCGRDSQAVIAALYANFKVALVLVDIDGRLWSISAPSDVGGTRYSELHSAQIDIFAGVSKSQSMSQSLTYLNYQSPKPTGFRSDEIMQIRLGVVQTFNETQSVDYTFGDLTILSL